jgi:hypothetical protein
MSSNRPPWMIPSVTKSKIRLQSSRRRRPRQRRQPSEPSEPREYYDDDSDEEERDEYSYDQIDEDVSYDYEEDDNSYTGYYEDEDDEKRKTASRRKADADYENDGSTGDEGDKEELGEEVNGTEKSRGGYYRVYFNDEVDPSETQLDWEVCSDDDTKTEALVLLPPAAVERPRAILHFVGGTFFGSAPKLWYRKLLEGIVRNTQTALIVTPIPVTLFKSPLQHTQLSKKLQRAFQYAWYTVLEDEYGEEGLQGVPLCGVGHSLGARLLTVMTTISQNKAPGEKEDSPLKSRKQRRQDKGGGVSAIPPYKSFILVSFTNYGASAGIPGVGTLLKQSRKQERAAKVNGERQRYKKARRARNDWFLADEYADEDDDDYADLDAEWDEVVDDLQALVKEQAARVKSALTPKSTDLEFFPSPDQLWRAVEEDGRYAVNETLLVQFDNDPVDQSSKLAQLLHATNSSNVKFARLHGTHLTPVSVIESDLQDNNSHNGGSVTLQAMLGTSAGALWKAILGKSKTRGQEIAMNDLRQSIVSYINDIVVK